jgi:hypothetical protein
LGVVVAFLEAEEAFYKDDFQKDIVNDIRHERDAFFKEAECVLLPPKVSRPLRKRGL